MEDFPADLLDRFEPERLIAAGGFGSVWLARQRALDRRVALKTLHAALAGNAEQGDRFRDEARVTASINHPGVVRLLDYGVGSVPWMAFELVDGPSLRARVQRGPQAWRDVAQIGMQVALALEEARRSGVIHRDIKPDNILEAGPETFKVADFGIAKWIDGSVQTADGVILGTPAYLSPVQVQGLQPEHQSDLYALGVTLFELLTGRLPFVEDNPLLMMERHRVAKAPRVRELVHDVPPELDRVIAKLLAKAREERYLSASELAADLAKLLAAAGRGADVTRRFSVRTPMAPPTSAVPRAPTGQAQRAVVLALAVAVGLFAVVALALRKAPPISIPSGNAPAVAASSNAPDLVEVERLRNEILDAFSSIHELSDKMPQEQEFFNKTARPRVDRCLVPLGRASRAFLGQLRRALAYSGPSAERLLVLEPFGEAVFENTARVLRFQIWEESLTTLDLSELVATIRQIRSALDTPPKSPWLSILKMALADRFDEMLVSPHIVTPRVARTALVRAAGALDALDRIGASRHLDVIVAQATLLDHAASQAHVDFGGEEQDVLSNAGPIESRDALVALAADLLALPRPIRLEGTPRAESILFSFIVFCARAAADPHTSRDQRRRAAIQTTQLIAIMTPAMARREGLLGYFGKSMLRVNEVLGEFSGDPEIGPLLAPVRALAEHIKQVRDHASQGPAPATTH